MRKIKSFYSENLVSGLSLLEKGEIKKALTLLHAASFEGNAAADFYIGYISSGVYEDYKNQDLYQLHMKKSADAGISSAQIEWATNLYKSDNYKSAIEYFEQAGKQGINKAYYWIYLCNKKMNLSENEIITSLKFASEKQAIYAISVLARYKLFAKDGILQIPVGLYLYIKSILLTIIYSVSGKIDDYA